MMIRVTAGVHIVSVSLGELHTVALSINGNVYAWGYNANGQARAQHNYIFYNYIFL